MALMTRPSKKLELSKIDEIQSEFFDDESSDTRKTPKTERMPAHSKRTPVIGESIVAREKSVSTQTSKTTPAPIKETKEVKPNSETKEGVVPPVDFEQGSMSIAALLATAKTQGVRHTSRPYTVPRSLTIDLSRLKSKFRTRSLQYTQNELMDKMVNESLEVINADNFLELREKAFGLVKSPEQCSRRSVTLTEETASEMNELKADLALTHNRRFSADEIFVTLLAVAFMPLYEDKLL